MNEFLKQRWYILGPPWAHGEQAGMTLIAGSEDPNHGTVVYDAGELLVYLQDEQGLTATDAIDQARAFAELLMTLHNKSLKRHAR